MMRISLQTMSSTPLSLARGSCVPLSVTIKPANNVPGSFEYQTDSTALLKLLRQNTDLSGINLDMFRHDLHVSTRARLPSIRIEDKVLQDLGYFID